MVKTLRLAISRPPLCQKGPPPDLYRSNGSHTAVTGAPLCTSGPKKDAWAKRRSCRDPTNRSTALVVSISLSAPK